MDTYTPSSSCSSSSSSSTSSSSSCSSTNSNYLNYNNNNNLSINNNNNSNNSNSSNSNSSYYMNRDLVMPIASNKLLYDFNNNDNLTTHTINMTNSTAAHNSNSNKNNNSNNNSNAANNTNNTSSFSVTNEFNQYYTTSSSTSTPIQITTTSNNSNNQAIANNNNNTHSHISASSKYATTNSNYLLQFNNNNNANDINECSTTSPPPPPQSSSQIASISSLATQHTQHQQHSYYKNQLLNQQFYVKPHSTMNTNQFNHANTYPTFNPNWSVSYNNGNELNNGFYQNPDGAHSMTFSTHIHPNGLIQTTTALTQMGTMSEEHHQLKPYITNFNDSNNNVDLTNLNVDLPGSLNPSLSTDYSNEIKNPTYFNLNPAMANYDYLINTKQNQLLSSIFKEIDVKKNQIRLADSEKSVKEHLIELTANIANCFLNNLCLDKNNNSSLTANLNSLTNLSKSSELEHISRPLLIAYAYLVDHDNMNDSLNRYIKKSMLFLLFSHQLTPYELKLIHLINKIYQTNETNNTSFVEMKPNRSSGSSSCSSSVSSSSSTSSSTSSSSSCMKNHRLSKRFKSECDQSDELTNVSPSTYYITKPKLEPFQPITTTTHQTCYEYYPSTYNENVDVKVETNYYFNDSGFTYSNGFDQTTQYPIYDQQQQQQHQQPATFTSTCQSIHPQNSAFSNGNSADSSLNQPTTVPQDTLSSKQTELKLLHFLLLLFSSYLEIDQFINGTEMPNENSINLNKYFNSMNASFCQKLIIKLIDRVCKDKVVKTKILLTVSELELI